MKLLFIEDEPDSIRPVIQLLESKGYHCPIVGFGDFAASLDEHLPEVVILDVLEKGASGQQTARAQPIFDLIWKDKFRPIVIYSANPDLLEGEAHPFLIKIEKGRDGRDKVDAALTGFKTHIISIRETEKYIRQQLAISLREVAPYAANLTASNEERSNIILRSGRRRLAALMDEMSHEGQNLESWEQYLHPPITKNLLLGDVLQVTGASKEEPSSFRIVLTPSCDLECSEKRAPKVNNVLVAHCQSIKDAIRATGQQVPGPEKLKKFKEKLIADLPSLLTQGFFGNMIPFPSLFGKIPLMAANLKSLELIPYGQNGLGTAPYTRVASLDSPFRELVAWAYIQVAGRPGLPDRNFIRWAEEIANAYTVVGEVDKNVGT